MKKVTIFIFIVLGLIAYFLFFNDFRNTKKPPVLSTQSLALKQARLLKQLALSHNAIDIEKFLGFTKLTDPFLFQMQEALFKSKKGLVLLRGNLQDISKPKNQYILEIEAWLGIDLATYRLVANPDIISHIIEDNIGRSYDIGVIARLKSIEKMAFEVEPIGEEVVVSSSNVFIIYGECLDFVGLEIED